MSPEWIEKQNERYRYVTEYNRDNAIDWLNSYYEHDEEDRDLVVDAANVIRELLEEANRNSQERFSREQPVYMVFVPHTPDCYYLRFEYGLMISKDKEIAGLAYSDFINVANIKRESNLVDCLFTMAEIKYWGLEDCNRVQIEW
ncbi:hypothetical protein [Limosilactobacillus fermentum]|uniref:hypothetical protein n=1 Tax=Limosilactobacillus fermentum TaxID=1613 RepID=UPI000FECD27A|nr:hypothetical protein [Limosilactobacillus fermentum]QAR22387.1 hypothetical protein EQG50_07970 [Limosilactobacillus fermentum]